MRIPKHISVSREEAQISSHSANISPFSDWQQGCSNWAAYHSSKERTFFRAEYQGLLTFDEMCLHLVFFTIKSRWPEHYCATKHGYESSLSYLARKAIRGERQSTIAGLSKQFSGLAEQVVRGAIYRRRSDDGIRCTCVSPDGVARGDRVIHALAEHTEIKQVLIDSTIVRAHRHAAGARKNGPQALGRSRGGLTTKFYLAVDDAGRPLRLIVAEGQVSDISCANEPVEHLRTGVVIAD